MTKESIFELQLNQKAMKTEKTTTESQNSTNAVLPAVAFVKKRNFSAKLPDDFVVLKSITKPDGNCLPNDPFMCYGEIDWMARFKTENFSITEDRILFSGSFSRWCVVRICQKLWEWLFPSVYKLEYLRCVKP